jgi:hypothetical protein
LAYQYVNSIDYNLLNEISKNNIEIISDDRIIKGKNLKNENIIIKSKYF